MNLDNPIMEFSYLILVTIAWIWATSQVWTAIQYPTGWRWSVSFWLSAKAFFLTQAGLIWWFNWTSTTWLERSIYVLVVAHLIVFVHWLRLRNPAGAPGDFSGMPEKR